MRWAIDTIELCCMMLILAALFGPENTKGVEMARGAGIFLGAIICVRMGWDIKDGD